MYVERLFCEFIFILQVNAPNPFEFTTTTFLKEDFSLFSFYSEVVCIFVVMESLYQSKFLLKFLEFFLILLEAKKLRPSFNKSI